MRGWSLNTWVVEWVETSTKSEREGFQDGSETCWVWFGDCGTNKDIGSQAEGGREAKLKVEEMRMLRVSLA